MNEERAHVKIISRSKIKRQIIDHHLKEICNIAQLYGIYSIEISSPITFHGKNQTKTDNVDKVFSKEFTEHIKKHIIKTHRERINSIFTNDVVAIKYSYLSILEKT